MFGKVKFHPWINLTKRRDIAGKDLPGVYMIARSETEPSDYRADNASIIYIGETTSQTLGKRIHQFAVSAFNEKPGHSGGNTFRKNKEVFGDVPETMLWVSVCPIQIDDTYTSAYIRYLERRQILKFVCAHGALPACNSK
ncbi:hypothetical protein [Dickeya solani]|uniref:GIY-YIG domain-containing protein n=1 Tax=Dickeya solani TaxID=1089444 RepID=A0ABU4E9J4_9GAMM|nr:hypothetical protein [Dickeya solani]MCA6998746.1 hypothetical protein [Dickeya solani]MCZ0822197.1 hypothetical protein [Dickeya solani]MDV6994704.1 hypothetical protein [Dickeya solani]MDV7004083.1 hypothetical protein [Dickeya solani]MDV7039746.1 hypothetical protein [Dickeya solani]